jgi:hypothetical protein
LNKARLYLEFHRSTLTINYIFSIALSSIIFPSFFIVLPISIMTGGPLLSLFYKEVAQKNEYYYYYNLGITKLSLILTNLILNILTGIILLIIITYVKSS